MIKICTHCDVNYKLAHLLRHRLNQALKGDAKIGSHVEYLGCSVDEFKLYLESKFESWMNWANYGRNGWEIDHVFPMSRANLSNIDELKKVCHYTNLQPLKVSVNRSKGNK
jgi:hypothetical protein